MTHIRSRMVWPKPCGPYDMAHIVWAHTFWKYMVWTGTYYYFIKWPLLVKYMLQSHKFSVMESMFLFSIAEVVRNPSEVKYCSTMGTPGNRWQCYWWERYVVDFMVMKVLCWWLSSWKKSVTNILNLSPTQNISIIRRTWCKDTRLLDRVNIDQIWW